MALLENEDSMEDWWTKVDFEQVKERKAMTSIVTPISWKIWKEHNAHVFQHVLGPTLVIMAMMKEEARAWCVARAKFLTNVIPEFISLMKSYGLS
jgi:hypothetical protein